MMRWHVFRRHLIWYEKRDNEFYCEQGFKFLRGPRTGHVTDVRFQIRKRHARARLFIVFLLVVASTCLIPVDGAGDGKERALEEAHANVQKVLTGRNGVRERCFPHSNDQTEGATNLQQRCSLLDKAF